MELKIFLIALPIAEIAIYIWLLIRIDRRQNRDNEDPVPLDDMPARYEDYEECFYNP